MEDSLQLNWKEHSRTFLTHLKNVKLQAQYDDASILCAGRLYPVHRIILSACSPYFEEIFRATEGKHPVIVLKDVTPRMFDCLLSFIYNGEVGLEKSELDEFLATASSLQVKGLFTTHSQLNKEPRVENSPLQVEVPSMPDTMCHKRKMEQESDSESSSKRSYRNSDSFESSNPENHPPDVMEATLDIKEENINDSFTNSPMEAQNLFTNCNPLFDSMLSEEFPATNGFGDSGERVPKHSYFLAPEPIFPNSCNLEDYLVKSKLGSLFMTSYQSKGHFTNSERTRLVAHIIDGILECNERVRTSQWIALSQKIVELFPTETQQTYFIPPRTIDNKRISRGKLVDRFRNQMKSRAKLSREVSKLLSPKLTDRFQFLDQNGSQESADDQSLLSNSFLP